MSEVISFQQAKQDRQPHWAGDCVCLDCRHEWTGVAPAGTHILECPECGLMKGHTKYLCGAEAGDLMFKCDCGCEAMTAYFRKGQFRIICMNCGTNQTEAIYG